MKLLCAFLILIFSTLNLQAKTKCGDRTVNLYFANGMFNDVHSADDSLTHLLDTLSNCGFFSRK